MGKLTRETALAKILSYKRPLRNGIGLLLAGLMILSCAVYPIRSDRPRGVYHRVKSGETLSIIARAYRVDLQELAEINNIDNPNRIETGSVVFVPDAQQVLEDIVVPARPLPAPVPPAVATPVPTPAPPPVPPPVPPREERGVAAIPKTASKPQPPAREAAQPLKRPEPPPPQAGVRTPDPPGAPERAPAAPKTSAKPEKEETARVSQKPDNREMADPPVRPAENDGKSDQIQFDKKRFIWPVRGKVVSHFGIQPNRMQNNGIRIAAAEGTAVQAAADGLVIFSAQLKDYGETIIVQHEGQYATVYAHLGIRTVRAESRVRKGDRIAFLGRTDPPEEPYLHFEIRQKNKARNPLFFLP